MTSTSPRKVASPLAQARVLMRAGSLSEALAVLERARAADPLDAQVLLELSHIAGRLSMHEAAERCTAAAIEIEPDDLEILVERSVALRAVARHDEAMDLLRVRLMSDPGAPELWHALANTVREKGLLSESAAFLEECLRLNPNNAEARANLADLMFDIGEHAKARELYEDAVRRSPKNAQMRFNRSLLALFDGDLKNGWRDYEYRLSIDANNIDRRFPGKPPRRWDGSARNGKPLLIMAEQGLGDQIMFASLVGELVARNDGPILMDCESRLVPLLQRSFPPVYVHPYAAKQNEGRTYIDYAWTREHGVRYAIDLGSLPKLLRPTVSAFSAACAPLLPDAREAAHWRSWLDSFGDAPKIGLCWRSGKRSGLRNLQYAPLDAWARFAAEIAGHLIVVQYSATDDELAELSSASGRVLHVPPELDQRNEIDRQTALLSQLDLVISAPTVVSMLSAATGTPTVKVTAAGTWTAFGLDHEAFFPAAKIIRPRQPGDWPEAFHLAGRAALSALARR